MTVIQFQTTCLRLVFMSFFLRNSERDRSVHSRFVCGLFFCSIMKQQQKLSSFSTEKRMAVESEKHEDVH